MHTPRNTSTRRLLFCAGFLIVALTVGATPQSMVPSAKACSVVDQRNQPFVRFVGKAVKRESLDYSLLGVSNAVNVRWTFLVKKWDSASAGKRRKVGSTVRVIVLEQLPPSSTTTSVNGGLRTSCSDVVFGVTVDFVKNRTYDVTALVDSSGSAPIFNVSKFAGLLQPR